MGGEGGRLALARRRAEAGVQRMREAGHLKGVTYTALEEIDRGNCRRCGERAFYRDDEIALVQHGAPCFGGGRNGQA